MQGERSNQGLEPIEAAIELLLTQMIDQQAAKVLRIARSLDSRITPEDARNPHDFLPLVESPEFQYEDGILAGLESARIALRAELRRLRDAKR
jgi:hypothetical protein